MNCSDNKIKFVSEGDFYLRKRAGLHKDVEVALLKNIKQTPHKEQTCRSNKALCFHSLKISSSLMPTAECKRVFVCQYCRVETTQNGLLHSSAGMT